ncbi:MAG: shikimate dehydrogenase [Desulfatibacillaceae bacterium]|nr:shikimate dehydrogenase [Desulfatibacillaceae bacterium]
MIFDSKTKLYGVFGHPVGHSLSPLMHNSAFAHLGINAVYLAFDVAQIGPAVRALRAFNMGGASVTIPHKVSVMDHLDEVDPLARSMGAVNTIVNRGGHLFGCNTDGPGAVAALGGKEALANKNLVVLGSGGAARAIAFAAKQSGATLFIANRREDEAQALALADELLCPFALISKVKDLPCDILINATPVGMTPNEGQTPVDKSFFKPGMMVMDAVYSPLETRLLREAKQAGCKVVEGVNMFIHQGAAQFALWTGQTAPIEIMQRIVYKALAKKQEQNS